MFQFSRTLQGVFSPVGMRASARGDQSGNVRCSLKLLPSILVSAAVYCLYCNSAVFVAARASLSEDCVFDHFSPTF